MNSERCKCSLGKDWKRRRVSACYAPSGYMAVKAIDLRSETIEDWSYWAKEAVVAKRLNWFSSIAWRYWVVLLINGKVMNWLCSLMDFSRKISHVTGSSTSCWFSNLVFIGEKISLTIKSKTFHSFMTEILMNLFLLKKLCYIPIFWELFIFFF